MTPKKLPMNESIFVSISCYRDPDIINTLQNLFMNAKFPNRIVVGTCIQLDHNEDALLLYGFSGMMDRAEFSNKIRVRMVSYKDSKGAGWARSEIQKNHFEDEDYYFQVDSHSRFIQDWDTILVDILKSQKTETNKVLLSAYPMTFDEYDKYKKGEFLDTVIITKADKFTGAVLNQASESRHVDEPVIGPVAYVAGGFIFAEGSFVKEVPYDPEIYFEGEETSLGYRAFTHGWDIFNPNRGIVFHDYNRNGNRHWDHNPEWGHLDLKSRQKYADLVNEKIDGEYGLGKIRTHGEWTTFTGVDMKNRTIINKMYFPLDVLDETLV
jgi:hypothetical protein